jgi:hypothetical protein
VDRTSNTPLDDRQSLFCLALLPVHCSPLSASHLTLLVASILFPLYFSSGIRTSHRCGPAHKLRLALSCRVHVLRILPTPSVFSLPLSSPPATRDGSLPAPGAVAALPWLAAPLALPCARSVSHALAALASCFQPVLRFEARFPALCVFSDAATHRPTQALAGRSRRCDARTAVNRLR